MYGSAFELIEFFLSQIPNPHDLGPLVENGVCAAGEPVHQEPSDGQMRKEFFDIGTAVWIAQR